MESEYGAYGEYELGYKSPLFAIEPGLVEMWEDPDMQEIAKKQGELHQELVKKIKKESPFNRLESRNKKNKTNPLEEGTEDQ